MRRLRRTPAPLALILLVAAINAVTWAVVVPPLQGPDEVGHFTYVQRMVETHSLPYEPHTKINPPGVSPYTSEVGAAQVDAGFGPLAGNPGARPYWTAVDERVWAGADAALGPDARKDGGFTSSLKNPPAYYLYEAVPYAVAHAGSFFDREMVMRLANVPLLLIALVFVWLMAGELFGRGRAQLLATGSAALLPQLMNMTATVNPDILLVAEWSAALYLMVRLLKHGPSRQRIACLTLLCVVGALTHFRSLPLLLPAALAVIVAVGRERGWRWASPGRAAAALGGTYVLAVLVGSVLGDGSLRQFLSYVWQFYLPRVGFMTPKLGPGDYGFRQAIPDRLFGTFAQLEVVLPHDVETAVYWLTIAGFVAVVVALVLRRRVVAQNSALAFVLGSAVIGLLAGVHLASYRGMIHVPDDPVFTARYLLPLLPLFGVAVALIARVLPARLGAAFGGLVLALGVALQLESLGLLLERFYA